MPTQNREHFENMIRAGYETMFEDKWDELHPESIERVMWRKIAKAMVLSFNFPYDFMRLHRELFNDPK